MGRCLIKHTIRSDFHRGNLPMNGIGRISEQPQHVGLGHNKPWALLTNQYLLKDRFLGYKRVHSVDYWPGYYDFDAAWIRPNSKGICTSSIRTILNLRILLPAPNQCFAHGPPFWPVWILRLSWVRWTCQWMVTIWRSGKPMDNSTPGRAWKMRPEASHGSPPPDSRPTSKQIKSSQTPLSIGNLDDM